MTRPQSGPTPHRLRTIELFAALDDEQLEWVARTGRPMELADGEVLFEDGESAQYFYVLLSGELLITKVLGGHEQVFSRHSARIPADSEPDGKPRAAYQYTGELPLLAGGGYVAKAVAVGRTELLAYDKETFLEMIARYPQICRVLVPVLAWRIRSYEALARRNALLEGLGTLAGGLAHELNNPAGALLRSVGELRSTVRDLVAQAVRWGSTASPEEQNLLDQFDERLLDLAGLAAKTRQRSALAAADAADMIADWLTERGVSRPDEIGGILADHALDVDALADLIDTLRPESIDAAIGCLAFSLQARTLVDEATEAGRRIEALVGSAKAYSNLDRAPVQDVDLREGIDATLAMQAAKLSGIRIHRSYADLPPLTAHPHELNQVWTNLINNAVDAMDGTGDLWLSTRQEGSYAVVEIGDNGPGIPPDILPLLFRPFFTTKDIGKGTGLGLYLSRDIVTHRHNGTIDVASEPGNTRFTVRLPLHGRTGA